MATCQGRCPEGKACRVLLLARLLAFTASNLESPLYVRSFFFHSSCCQQAVNYPISLRFKNLNFKAN